MGGSRREEPYITPLRPPLSYPFDHAIHWSTHMVISPVSVILSQCTIKVHANPSSGMFTWVTHALRGHVAATDVFVLKLHELSIPAATLHAAPLKQLTPAKHDSMLQL